LYEGHDETASVLLEATPKNTLVQTGHWSPLPLSIRLEKGDFVAEILKISPPSHSTASTLLPMAASSGSLPLVQLLCEISHVSINPALYPAVRSGSTEILNFLLEKFSKVDRVIWASSLLFTAVQQRRVNILEALLKAGGDPTSSETIHLAVRMKDLAMVQTLTSHNKVLLDQQDLQGNTALHWAADGDWVEALPLLITKENLQLPNQDGWSPLHLAVSANALRAAEKLLQAGADVHQKNSKKNARRPIHIAAAKGFSEMVELLIRYKSELEPRIEGALGPATPLEMAFKGLNFSANFPLRHQKRPTQV
jgi:ankyrin repeat protein